VKPNEEERKRRADKVHFSWHQTLAVRREGERGDQIRMTYQIMYQLLGSSVP
jgi:hypothetical protein